MQSSALIQEPSGSSWEQYAANLHTKECLDRIAQPVGAESITRLVTDERRGDVCKLHPRAVALYLSGECSIQCIVHDLAQVGEALAAAAA